MTKRRSHNLEEMLLFLGLIASLYPHLVLEVCSHLLLEAAALAAINHDIRKLRCTRGV